MELKWNQFRRRIRLSESIVRAKKWVESEDKERFLVDRQNGLMVISAVYLMGINMFIYEKIPEWAMERYGSYYRWQKQGPQFWKWVVDKENDRFIIRVGGMVYIPANVKADEGMPPSPDYYFMRSDNEYFGVECDIVNNKLHFEVRKPVLHLRQAIKHKTGRYVDFSKELITLFWEKLNYIALEDGLIDSIEDYIIVFEPFTVVAHDDEMAHTVI